VVFISNNEQNARPIRLQSQMSRNVQEAKFYDDNSSADNSD